MAEVKPTIASCEQWVTLTSCGIEDAIDFGAASMPFSLMKRPLKVLPALVLAMLAGEVGAYEVTSQDIFSVKFHLPSATRSGLAATDTLYLAISPPSTGDAFKATAQLFDGSTLLGTNTAENGTNSTAGFPFCFYWTDSHSNYASALATNIDASSMINRSIAGEIRVKFAGTVQFTNFSLDAGNGWLSSVGVEGGNHAIIDSVSILPMSAVPEPSVAGLLLAGLVVVGSSLRKRFD